MCVWNPDKIPDLQRFGCFSNAADRALMLVVLLQVVRKARDYLAHMSRGLSEDKTEGSSPLPCVCSPSLLCAHSLGARMARMPRRPILNVRMPCVFQVQTFIPLMAEETIRRGLRASRRAGEHIPPDHPQKHDSCLLIRLSAACYGCLGRNLGVLLQPACCAVCVG